ncbi:MAG TPA: cytochrome o ubiquinol oxidase subunit III [Candidatus Saccharimonadales bacterium]|nr:cytochrome o ubiquinol oxidase subunit III [Candidatus Saccharimonadales bacterium]
MANSKKIIHHENHQEAITRDKTVFGFWVYLMTDLLMFAVLFATYAVLHGNIFNGPSGKEMFDLPFALTETLILLTSSFTAGLAILAVRRHGMASALGVRQNNKNQVLLWLGITFLLGLSFLGLEISEFSKLVKEGNSWQRSAFLSSYFTLVATHGLHITVGLFWMAICMIKVKSQGLTVGIGRKLTLLSLFWHFLDIVWIFIFTIVYLMGAI